MLSDIVICYHYLCLNVKSNLFAVVTQNSHLYMDISEICLLPLLMSVFIVCQNSHLYVDITLIYCHCLCPCAVQVIVERYHKEKVLPMLDKTKFLVPQELTMSQFLTIIRFVIMCLQYLLQVPQLPFI